MKISLYLVAILVFSQLGNIIRFSESHAIVTTFWRLVLSAAIILPIVAYSKGFTDFKKLNKNGWLKVFVSGLCLFITFTLFIFAVGKTTVAQATILFSMHPLTTALFGAIFLAEPLTKHMKVALGLGLVGVVVLFNGGVHLDSQHMEGSIYAILTAVCFSGYLILSKSIRTQINNTAYTSAIYSIAAIFGLITLTALDMPFLENSEQSWYSFLALAVFPTLLGHALFTYLLKHLNINFVSCGILAHPPLAALSAHYLFGEVITNNTIIGFAFTSLALLSLLVPYELLAKIIFRKDKAGVLIKESIRENFNLEVNIETPELQPVEASSPASEFKQAS